jgi:hypothetical protein
MATKKKNNKNKQPKERSIYDDYLQLLEEKENSQSFLIDDGSVFMMKYDGILRDLEALKNDVRKAAGGTMLAHARVRKNLRKVRHNVVAMIKLSIAITRHHYIEKNKNIEDLDIEESLDDIDDDSEV